MPDNYGAKDHLRPILLGMKARGLSASRILEAVIVSITVPVSRGSNSTGGSDEMDS